MSPRIDDLKVAFAVGVFLGALWMIVARLFGYPPIGSAAALLALLFGSAYLDSKFGTSPNPVLWAGAIIGLIFGAAVGLESFR